MTGLHESTLALSVYNAIARAGSMTREQALALLQKHWEPALELSEVAEGAALLIGAKILREVDGVLSAARSTSGAAATLVRHPLDLTKLVYSRVQTRPAKGVRLDAQ